MGRGAAAQVSCPPAHFFSSCCCSVTKLCLILRQPVDCSTPGFPVPHHLSEFAQIHVHCIRDATQPSHPLSPLLLLPSVLPSIRVFSDVSALHFRCQSIGASASASVPPVIVQGRFPLRLTGLICYSVSAETRHLAGWLPTLYTAVAYSLLMLA